MRRRRLGVLLCAGLLAPAAGAAQQRGLAGHWVSTTPDTGFWIIGAQPDGRVYTLVPAPEFEATYRFGAGNTVELRGSDGSTVSFVLRGDTLVTGGQPTHVRIAGASRPGTGGRGTWRSLSTTPVVTFVTFRSDSQVVLEVGFVAQTLQGDTLQVSPPEVPTVDFTLRVLGDTLYTRIVRGEESVYVRRPWGCLGKQPFDSPAAECR